ncbi:MAG: hypothetical protein ACFHWX_07930 [Bacteroidota bacterium]
MKKLTFTLGLIGFLVISASAQYFQSHKSNPGFQEPLPKGDSLTFYPKFKRQFSDRIFSPQSFGKTDNKPMEEKELSSYRHDNMPNLEPEGMFPLRIIKPDESVDHSLIVVPPNHGLKLRISNGLSEKLNQDLSELEQSDKE